MTTQGQNQVYNAEHGHYHEVCDEDQGAFIMNTDDLPPQPPMPSSTQDWELSWSRTYRWMRLRDPKTDQFWFAKQMVGKAQMVATDSQVGRMTLRGRTQLVGDQIFLYYPKDGNPNLTPDQIQGQRLPNSHWRLCYHRAGRDWRLRNERTNELTFVNDYRGNISINWLDHGSHVFHDGPVVLDKDGIAYFIDPELAPKVEIPATASIGV
jgi:hypothetical protein